MNRIKVIYWSFAYLFVPLSLLGQTSLIKFETNLSWKEVQEKAKRENRYIFMDCYATWCGPCKWMTQHVFSNEEVGAFLNTHFVNVAVQMDKTPNDSPRIRGWYLDADSIKSAYCVQNYPTYLFFAPDGTAVHCFIGSTSDGNEFILKAVDALDPSRQLFTLDREWAQHKSDSSYLWQAFNVALRGGKNKLAKNIIEAYIECQPDLFTTRNLQLIAEWNLFQSSQDAYFQLFLRNADRINDSLRSDNGISNPVAWVLRRVIRVEELQPLYDKREPIYWSKVSEKLKQKYPTIGNDLIELLEDDFKYNIEIDIKLLANQKVRSFKDWYGVKRAVKSKYPDYAVEKMFEIQKAKYYYNKKLWNACANATYDLIYRFGDQITGGELNDMAWDYIFVHSNDKKILSEAARRMKRLIDQDGNNEEYLDTYANLLYKIGRRAEALEWENKAIETAVKMHANLRNLKMDQTNLEKMQRGEPTWG